MLRVLLPLLLVVLSEGYVALDERTDHLNWERCGVTSTVDPVYISAISYENDDVTIAALATDINNTLSSSRGNLYALWSSGYKFERFLFILILTSFSC